MKKKKIMIILTLLMAIVCLTEKTNAATSIGIYAGYNGYNGSCSENGYYNYDKLGPNVQGQYYWSKGAINTTISGKAKNIAIAFKYDLDANKTYDVVINFYGSDLTNKLKVNNFQVYKTLGCGDGRDYNDSTLNLISFTNSATSSSNTNKLKFRISTLAVIGDWEVTLLGGENNITSINNFGIKSVTINEVDTSGNNQIIENNNNNTNNIINNQKQNTQDIMDNQNKLLGEKCRNKFNGEITSSNFELGTFTPNTNYVLSFEGTFTGYNIRAGNGGTLLKYCETNVCKFTTDSTGVIFFNGWGVVTPLTNVMLVEGITERPYCEYGTYGSKIDETNDILKKDHTYNNNPSQSTTNEQNQMNSFEQEEDTLRNSLNLDIEDTEITINPYASSFIWDVVNRLRTMNGKIVLLFTSVLSLGIMKMILGR